MERLDRRCWFKFKTMGVGVRDRYIPFTGFNTIKSSYETRLLYHRIDALGIMLLQYSDISIFIMNRYWKVYQIDNIIEFRNESNLTRMYIDIDANLIWFNDRFTLHSIDSIFKILQPLSKIIWIEDHKTNIRIDLSNNIDKSILGVIYNQYNGVSYWDTNLSFEELRNTV